MSFANCFGYTNAFPTQVKYISYLRRSLVLFFNCLFLLRIQGMGPTQGRNPCAIGLSVVGATIRPFSSTCDSAPASEQLVLHPQPATRALATPWRAPLPGTLPPPLPRGKSSSHKTIQLGWCPHLIRLLQMVGQKQ